MFQDSWTLDYLFIEWKDKPLCSICGKKLSAAQLFSVKRHYKTLHEAKYAGFAGKSKEDFAKKLQTFCLHSKMRLKRLSSKLKIL